MYVLRSSVQQFSSEMWKEVFLLRGALFTHAHYQTSPNERMVKKRVLFAL
jgi:hypothetical protein